MLGVVTDSGKKLQVLSPTALKDLPKNIILFGLKNFLFSAVGNSDKIYLLLSPTALRIL
jgi:hypothetical protein